jgi:hypothetical protein
LPEEQRWAVNEINLGSKTWRKDKVVLDIALGYPFKLKTRLSAGFLMELQHDQRYRLNNPPECQESAADHNYSMNACISVPAFYRSEPPN